MLQDLVATGFNLASRVRGSKAFHPRGVVHEATLRITGSPEAPAGAPLLREPGEHRAVVRLSLGAGLPRPLPDVRGLAIRIPDAHGEGRHQDFLLVTSGDGALAQHLLLPARSYSGLPYSCLIPYRIDGEPYIVGAYARPSVAWRAGGDHEQLMALAHGDEPAFDLGIARLGHRLRPVGSLRLGPRLPDDRNALRFNPFNTGGGLEPATFLSSWRRAAYPASQAGWEGADAEALTDPRA